MKPQVWRGELLRWYLKHARHPFKGYLVGHYWDWFSRRQMWVTYDDHAVIHITLGDYLQQRIFFEGYYERGLVMWLKETLQPSDVFWDVGANVGAVTLVASRLCKRVVAFEPDPRSLSVLAENVRRNDLVNVEIIPAGLGESPGTAVLHQAPDRNTGMSSIMEDRLDGGSATAVEIWQADTLIRQRPELAPTVIKIDVEGAEHLVLRGARALLRQRIVRALVFEDRRDDQRQPTNHAVVACLRDAGYRISPLAQSDEGMDDGMLNFLALPGAA